MQFFLPDTNIFIYAFKGIEPYSTFIESLIKENKLVISSVVIAEFLAGSLKNEELPMRQLMDKFEILPVDALVAEKAGEYKKKYSQKTKKVWLVDCFMAATCKVFGATLITSNRNDYPMDDIDIKSF